jgi:acetolactate synthase-1/3 small subunit
MAELIGNGKTEHQHVFSVLVENHFGVLARIAGLFGARGFNIDSLAVGETHDPSISRITLVTHGDDRIIEQIQKQLNKLIDVIKVQDLTTAPHVERELMLLKINATSKTRSEIIQIVDIYKSKIVDFTPKSITVEIVGDQEKIESFVAQMRPFGIMEMARTGRIAVNRGSGGLQSSFLAQMQEDRASVAQNAPTQE